MRYVNLTKSKNSKFLQKYKKLLLVIGFLVFLGVAIAFFAGSSSTFSYIFSGGLGIKNTDGKVNILLLGNPGGVHDGPYLTDTVMVASLDLKKHKINLISLPRDLWLTDLKIKLNAVYETGQSRGGGLRFTKEAVSDILGIPLHYGLRIDFRGFIKAVDQVGGLDIDVERSFEDYFYPIAGKEDDLCGLKEEEKDLTEEESKLYNLPSGKQKVILTPDNKIATEAADFACRFERISFKAGTAHLGGEAALKFARSRMGTNMEGSDFARSKRQQKVIESFRAKALSFETLVNPSQISSLFNTFGESVEVDLPVDDAIILYGFVKKTDLIQSFIIDGLKENSLLINPPVGDYGAWVLVPKSGSYSDIHDFVKKIMKGVINESSSSARTSY
ncbi:LCP family protein [Candidatus Daviesbacteria bacterium]|nr:LCP family protein [Candidatus Daviesbacteria bacterium]